jgi:predicted pyridoxine 5'-phosphate oxidase superfamily flavin-nucleotide-binding protein
MATHFLDLAITPSVVAEQLRYYGRAVYGTRDSASPADELGEAEHEFIRTRDSFYMSSVSEMGWPYIQHRGGAPGFLRVLGPNRLGFADVGGNRQLLSTGNLAQNDRVALFLMDYPQRSRLKIYGHARVTPAKENSSLAALLSMPGAPPAERLMEIEVVAFDWNCPKYITPRYTVAEVEEVTATLRARIAELEVALKKKPG